jgi:uncharacterized protein YjgD (DUF1641 family)
MNFEDDVINNSTPIDNKDDTKIKEYRRIFNAKLTQMNEKIDTLNKADPNLKKERYTRIAFATNFLPTLKTKMEDAKVQPEMQYLYNKEVHTILLTDEFIKVCIDNKGFPEVRATKLSPTEKSTNQSFSENFDTFVKDTLLNVINRDNDSSLHQYASHTDEPFAKFNNYKTDFTHLVLFYNKFVEVQKANIKTTDSTNVALFVHTVVSNLIDTVRMIKDLAETGLFTQCYRIINSFAHPALHKVNKGITPPFVTDANIMQLNQLHMFDYQQVVDNLLNYVDAFMTKCTLDSEISTAGIGLKGIVQQTPYFKFIARREVYATFTKKRGKDEITDSPESLASQGLLDLHNNQ